MMKFSLACAMFAATALLEVSKCLIRDDSATTNRELTEFLLLIGCRCQSKDHLGSEESRRDQVSP